MSSIFDPSIPVPQSHFYSQYSKKLRVQISFPEDSPFTKQSFAEECDINTIMARYMSTGELPELDQRAPQYLDVSAGIDFQESMEFIAGAKTLFNELPSELRGRFENDPRQFLDFVGDPKNRTEMADLGLLSPEATLAVHTERDVMKTALEAHRNPPKASAEKATPPAEPVDKKD